MDPRYNLRSRAGRVVTVDDSSQDINLAAQIYDDPGREEYEVSDHESEEEDDDEEEEEEEKQPIPPPPVPVVETEPVSETVPPLSDYEEFFAEQKQNHSNHPIAFLDVEWHSLKRIPKLIAQIAVVSLDGKIRLNAYVKYKELHDDWLEMVDNGIVTLNKQDSYEAMTLGQCMQLLVDRFDKRTTFLYAGSMDGASITESIFALLSGHTDLINKIKQRRYRFVSVNACILQDMKSAGFGAILGTKAGGSMRKLHVLFDICFYKYVIVKDVVYRLEATDHPVPASLQVSYTTRQVLDGNQFRDDWLQQEWIDEQDRTKSMIVQFRGGQHIEPQYHTADTDVMVLRDVVAFWCLYQATRRRIEIARGDRVIEGILSNPPASFCELSTYVVKRTQYLRQHLGFTDVDQTLAWIHHLINQSNKPVFRLNDKLAQLATQFMDNSSIIWRESLLQKNKKKRDATHRAANEVSRLHVTVKLDNTSELATVIPLYTKSANRSKIEAFRSVVDEESKRFNDAFDEHDHMRVRIGLEPVGNRPWYFMPAQFGTKADNTYILHCRHCDQFRLKGDTTGLKKKKAAGAIKLSSINVQAVLRYKQRLLTRFVFCKECKHYKDEQHEIVLENETRISHVDKVYEPVLETDYTAHAIQFDEMDIRTDPDRPGAVTNEEAGVEMDESWIVSDVPDEELEAKYNDPPADPVFIDLYENDSDTSDFSSDEEETELELASTMIQIPPLPPLQPVVSPSSPMSPLAPLPPPILPLIIPLTSISAPIIPIDSFALLVLSLSLR